MKTPLVLLSGLLSNETVWRHQTSHLDDIASIQVISPSENSPEKMVQAILDQAPPMFALAGHSMGGWLSLEILRTAPSRVIKLCLLNTTSRMDSEDKQIKRQEMIQKAEKGEFPEIVKQIVENFIFNPLCREEVEEMFLSVGPEIFIRQEQAMAARKECLSILPTIHSPTLVIHAREDKNFSLEEQEELIQNIPNAKLAIVEDSGHMSPLEMPQAVTTLLRFWLTNL